MAYKQRHYEHPTDKGVYSIFPWSLHEAEARKQPQYTGLSPCPRCGTKRPYYYVRSRQCASCANKDRSEYSQNRFFGAELPMRDDRIFQPDAAHPFTGQQLCAWGPHEKDHDPDTNACRGCERELGYVDVTPDQQVRLELGADLTQEEAKAAGYRLFLGGVCVKGHPGWRHVANGRCYDCLRGTDPGGMLWTKEEAKAAGKPRYRTGEPCSNGHTGWRHMSDDTCEECERPRPRAGRKPGPTKPEVEKRKPGRPKGPPKPPVEKRKPGRPGRTPKPPAPPKPDRRSRESRLPPPETIIDRQSADVLGWTFYRTGEPCRNGHAGFRYVRTAQCIDCLSGKPAAPRMGAPAAAPGLVGRPLSPDAQMARDNPDMVICRDDARLLGLSLFRTGKTCLNGHKGWRRVDSGACVECLKERRNRYK